MLHRHDSQAPHIPPSAAATALRLDAKRATHDGHIWPRPRRLMTIAACICERMAEDLAGLVRDAGAFETVCDDALIALGWEPEQVRRYGDEAARRVRREHSDNDNPTRHDAREAA